MPPMLTCACTDLGFVHNGLGTGVAVGPTCVVGDAWQQATLDQIENNNGDVPPSALACEVRLEAALCSGSVLPALRAWAARRAGAGA